MRSAQQEAMNDMARLACDLVDLGHYRMASMFLEAIIRMGDGEPLVWSIAETVVEVRQWMASL